MLVIYLALVGATWGLFKVVPGGFVPRKTSSTWWALPSCPMAPRWIAPKM